MSKTILPVIFVVMPLSFMLSLTRERKKDPKQVSENVNRFMRAISIFGLILFIYIFIKNPYKMEYWIYIFICACALVVEIIKKCSKKYAPVLENKWDVSLLFASMIAAVFSYIIIINPCTVNLAEEKVRGMGYDGVSYFDSKDPYYMLNFTYAKIDYEKYPLGFYIFTAEKPEKCAVFIDVLTGEAAAEFMLSMEAVNMTYFLTENENFLH